jgi:MFS family permease
MGFLLVTSVLVVSFGRVGDIFGRVRMYTLGFAIFTVFSILLSVTWMSGPNAALWIIIMRVGQGVGGAFIFANSMAIITDAFPAGERGFAIGINGVAAIGGSFIGLLLGGLLAPVEWRLVFLVSVPFGIFGTLWAYFRLHDNGMRIKASIDWIGNIAFAVGLVAVLTGIVYGLQPYGGHTMGWTSPFVLAACSAAWRRAGRPSWSSSTTWTTRCSSSTCSGAGPSPWATWPACWPPWPGVACSSC